MIDARELRIGNTVNYRLPSGEMIPVTIGGIQPFSLMQYVGIESYYRDINDYFPIELSEQWLIKFGFEQNIPVASREYLKRNIMVINHYNNGFIFKCDYWQAGVMIKYVHQIQNLYFSLTGAELTIQS